MAQYLPVLLVSVSALSAANPASDDSSLDTQAVGQVDYLSHQWQEEDVAKSWRNMTRRKDSIQNGARLENASWRTWWKQRNNLPTVSPETLNWLKDSDVTWLYGPLHTAADWAPPPRHSSELGSATSSPASPALSASTLHPNPPLRPDSSRSNSPWPLKPILKHRSISELLSISLPPSPGSEPMEVDEEQDYFDNSTSSNGDVNTAALSSTRPGRELTRSDAARKRPKLTHTKSDTNVQRNPFWRESPPLPPRGSPPSDSSSLSPPSHTQTGRSRESSCGDSGNPQKRHISFNTFVEQCIAIEKPDQSTDGFYGVLDEDDGSSGVDGEDDGYREDDEDSENDDIESEEEMLEMRTPRSRTSSSRRITSLSATSSTSPSGWAGPDLSTPPDREHVTIAPIAPTMLKTSASPSPAGSYLHGTYGSLWEEEEEEHEEALFVSGRTCTGAYPTTERADSVNLVYVPPQGSVYAGRISGLNGSATGASGAKAFGYPLSSPPRATAELRAASFDDVDILIRRRRELVEPEPPFESGFDFFGGPDMGGAEEYSAYRSGSRSGRSPAQLRTASASDLRSNATSNAASARTEETTSVMNSKGSSGSASEDGTVVPPSLASPPLPRAPLKTSRSAQSPSPVSAPPPSPSSAISVPRHQAHLHLYADQSPSPAPSLVSTSTFTTTSTTSGGSGSFLEPPPRGRSTSPITSASASGDGIRGRSSLRANSSNSLSDRERSGREEREPQRGRSRSRSTGAGSPLEGSVSPRNGSRVGGAIGLGGYGTAYGLGASPTWRDKSLSPEENDGTRKREKIRSRVRRSGSESRADSSVSPPSTLREKGIVVVDDGDPTPEGLAPPVDDADLACSKNPTPSNSPVSTFKPLASSSFPIGAAANASSIPDTAISQARVPSDESATLAGRAAEIVSSAKGYLGSFWGSAERERQLQHNPEGSVASTASR